MDLNAQKDFEIKLAIEAERKRILDKIEFMPNLIARDEIKRLILEESE